MGVRIKGLVSGVWGFRVLLQGSGFRVLGFGYRVEGLESAECYPAGLR